MADEQEPIAEELEITPAIEVAEAEPEAEQPETVPTPGDEPEAEAAEGEEEPEAPEVEYVTVERNGKSYQIPKELEGELLMNADYTKKTQSVAELKRALESREVEMNQRAEATEAELDARAELRTINAQLDEFNKLTPQDWQTHYQNDPFGTQQAKLHFDMLKDQKAALEGKVSQAAAERTEKAQQDLAKRVQDTLEAAPRIIPGFTPETSAKIISGLVEFANSEGIPEQTLTANWSPALLKLLHQAKIGAEAMKKAAQKPALPKQTVEPLATVKAKTSPAPSRSLHDLARSDDLEAYAARRREQMGRR